MKKTNTSVSFRSGVHRRNTKFKSWSHSVFSTVLFFLLFGSYTSEAQLCQLACYNAQVSVDMECQAEITVGMIADTTLCVGGQFSAHVLTLADDTIPSSPWVTELELGQTLKASIYDAVSGNSCWSYITVEDKMPPQITCNCPEPINGTIDPACIVKCSDVTELPPSPLPMVTDNCTDPQDIELVLLDQTSEPLCDTPFIKKVTRYYTAFDAAGNQSDTCVEVLFLERLDFSDIDFPDSLTLSCDDPNIGPDGIPDPAYTGVPQINGVDIYPDFMFYCNAAVFKEDLVIGPIGCVNKIMRMWQVFEWHCLGERDTLYIQLIEIVDNAGPELDCPDDFFVSTNGHDCDATVHLPRPYASDNCNNVSHISASYPGGFIEDIPSNYYVDLPVGENIITYTAYDDCYNPTSCTTVITVADETPPIPVCDEHTIVSLTTSGIEGLTKVPASVFDDGSYDMCGPVTIMGRRMDSCLEFDWTTNGAGIDDIPDGYIDSRDRGTVHRPKVPFACCDVGEGPIMIELRIEDASENVNYCMVEVEVQDKIGPQIECPNSITVSCEFDFDLTDLSIFGTVRTSEEERQEICVFDPANPAAIGDFVCIGLDGIAYDNCDVTITSDSDGDLDNCGVGHITRTWTATDPGGRINSCIQQIWVENFTPFYINDNTCYNNDPFDGVIWPCDKELYGCGGNTAPENTGFPTFIEDECDLIGYTYEDLEFPFVEGACFKILRTWQVIDWCQFAQNPSAPLGYDGYWEYQQVIKVLNTDAPFFTTFQDPISVCNEFDCGGIFVELVQLGGDDCTPVNELKWEYGIDVDNDGSVNENSFGTGNRIDASAVYPIGFHRIIYTFEDQCGNKTTREQLFEVLGCKPPTPICINGLSADLMPVDTDNDGDPDWGMITIWASDFDKGSLHACGYPVTVSFSPDTTDKSKVFDCTDVGPDGVSVQLWVTDLVLGNQAFCETYIIIQDNMEVCPENPGGNGVISGQIETQETDMVASVQVGLDGSAMFPVVTNSGGLYAFPAMPYGGSYQVSPEKNDDYMNGVSTLDLVHIQKHLLGIQGLSSTFDIIAADANNSGSISAVDLVELRKLILGIYEELPNNDSWRFVDKNYNFPNPADPWTEEFPETYTIQQFNSSMQNVNFIGIKVGDVNNTVQANLIALEDRSAPAQFAFVVEDKIVRSGELIELEFTTEEITGLIGYQFTMWFDQNALSVAGVQSERITIRDENIALHEDAGLLTMSWNDIVPVEIDNGDVLFRIAFEARFNGILSEMVDMNSDMTAAEIYSDNGEVKQLQLRFDNKLSEGGDSDYVLYQNQPNPFSSGTTISYRLPENQKVTVQVFDVTGTQILSIDQDGAEGYNEVILTEEQLNANGVLYYTIRADQFTATRKMMRIE